MLILRDVYWYIKADLKNGFRQFGTHPHDWRFQGYCNGLDEHYIDIACPFGKTNSTLEFCPPVSFLRPPLRSGGTNIEVVMLLDLVPMLMTSMGAFRNVIVMIQH